MLQAYGIIVLDSRILQCKLDMAMANSNVYVVHHVSTQLTRLALEGWVAVITPWMTRYVEKVDPV